MPVDKYELGKKMIALASQYRQMGDELSKNAYTKLKTGSVTKQDYVKILDNVQKLFEQAIEINRKVMEIVEGSIDVNLQGIESATKKLEQATNQINKIEEIVKISIDALTAIGAVVLAVISPSPGTIATAANSAVSLAREIIEMGSSQKAKRRTASALKGSRRSKSISYP
jgi:hypothetical protein